MNIQTLIELSNETLNANNCLPWQLNPESLEEVSEVVNYLESNGFTKSDISVIHRPEVRFRSGRMTTWVGVRVKAEGDFFLNKDGNKVSGACRNYVALSTLARRVQKGEKLSFGGSF